MLNNFYAVMGNPPEVVGALNGMAGALLEEGATVEQVAIALRACRRVPYPVRLPHILERLPGHGADDGRPEPETAWAMCPKSDEASVVWTEEMMLAFDGARRLLLEGDSIAARMAFKESYAAELNKARTEGRPIKWSVSLGFDKADQVRVLSEAIEKRRIPASHAYGLLGPEQQEELRMALPSSERKQLTGEKADPQLGGFAGVLKQLADGKSIPGDLTPKRATVSGKPLTPEELKERRGVVKQQLEVVRKRYGKEQRA